MKELVECHSEYEYPEKPIAIWWQDERMIITQILREARIPDGKYFRVSTSEGFIFDLLYKELFDQWLINQL